MSDFDDWRPVRNHEGAYEVARPDRVRSIDRVIERRGHRGAPPFIQHLRGKELSSRNHHGKQLVWLYDREHRRHQRTVASLVAEAFGEAA
ncbi:hypothetical protein [Mycobacterium avium]|uniref:hypothetical protein n=1 Tax=Mycobacterium avium TaxID=1764 RepID=UPI002666D6C0|nr:hypothetical protein [Mycobacterium avium]MDO2354670.1 hypothetical protein [Mycobacterium avium subsp. hominissuis]